MVTAFTAHPQKAVLQTAALEVVGELPLHVVGQVATLKVSGRIMQLHQQGQRVECVWTQKKLIIANEKYAVDHCFPWSRWLNNDLWNLMPTTTAANNAKSDKLPSAELLLHSRDHILQWWERAYLEDERMSQLFYIDAEAALPLMNAESRDLDGVFHAMQHQRARLRASQQLGEWRPLLKL